METLSIQLSTLSEVSLRCVSDNPESDSRAAQPPCSRQSIQKQLPMTVVVAEPKARLAADRLRSSLK
jgi:hypothetical protein